MPILRQVRVDRRKKESCWLNTFAANVTSQTGEDGILAKLFDEIGEGSKWCVEFGAWDGKKFSNTFSLIAEKDWSGVLIEGSAAKFSDLVATYADNTRAICLNAIVHPEAGNGSLDSYLATTPIPKTFDLLSIDVDGNDYYIWETTEIYRPRVVVIEFNPAIPNDVIFIQDRDLMINQGCSLRALVELGKAKGYELACATKFNGIFVDAKEFPQLRIYDNSVDAMSFPACDAKFFDGYDGTLFHVGMNRLHWMKAIEFGAEDLQILEPSRRGLLDGIKSSLMAARDRT
jgi:hypothetical protein